MESIGHELRERLRHVLDPELGASIVDLGMVGDVSVADRVARIPVALTTIRCPLRQRIEREVTQTALEVEGIDSVVIDISEMSPEAKADLMDTARRIAQTTAPETTIPRTTPVIAVMSGKGGVGKSSVTANMAVALSRRGFVVGVIDADIWGFSLPRLLGIEGSVQAVEGKMQPLTRREREGELRLLSMGFLSEDDRALMWRGLIVQRAVQQFIEDADWTGIDYLLIDTPPGTGDIAMGLSRLLPQMTAVVVTTPALAAQRVASRAADFARRSHIRVLGVIENMSPFRCSCGEHHAIFGEGGGAELADTLRVPLLAAVPLDTVVAHGGDTGQPAMWAMEELAERLVTDLAPPAGAVGCSARLLDAVERAVADYSS
jgi:ATP-binding protein involved in chromosome partitioning